MNETKKRETDNRWYYKLSCGHVRLIDRNLKPLETEQEFYCVTCDHFGTAVKRSERF